MSDMTTPKQLEALGRVETLAMNLHDAARELGVAENTDVPGLDLEEMEELRLETMTYLEEQERIVRHWLDHRRQLLGLEEPDDPVVVPVREQIQARSYGIRALDLRMQTERNKIKWYNPFTEVGDRTGKTRRTKKKGVCVHHTGVYTGFGISSARVNSILERAPYLDFAFESEWIIGTSSVKQAVEALALAERYAGQHTYGGVPYHGILARNRVLYFNLPMEWVTWHGNGANTDFLGFAFDMHSGRERFGDEGMLTVLQAREALELFIDTARDDGHDIREITVHGAWTNKPKDPGAQTITEVIEPVADRKGLRIDWDFKTNGGRSMAEMKEAA